MNNENLIDNTQLEAGLIAGFAEVPWSCDSYITTIAALEEIGASKKALLSLTNKHLEAATLPHTCILGNNSHDKTEQEAAPV